LYDACGVDIDDEHETVWLDGADDVDRFLRAGGFELRGNALIPAPLRHECLVPASQQRGASFAQTIG